MNANELEGTLDRIQQAIRNIDTKITPILAVDTSMLGVTAVVAKDISEWTCLSLTLALVAVSCLLFSLLFILLASFPRTSGPKGSLIYFQCIKEKTTEEYLKAIKKASEDDYLSDLASQCHRNAEIASIKYHRIKFSMILLFSSIVPWLLLIYLIKGEVLFK